MTSKGFLITGLGNPGKKYENTRHNFGFMVVKAFAEKQRWTFKADSNLQGEIALGTVSESKVILLLPKTYMNLSGQSVRKVLDYYKIDLTHFLVVADDIALDFGTLRFREKGSSGGHNGLKDIESHLGTQEYQRLRLGIGDREHGYLEDYVLSPFSAEEQKDLPKVIEEGVDFLDKWLMKETYEKSAKETL